MSVSTPIYDALINLFIHLTNAFRVSIVYNAIARNHKRNFKCHYDIDFHFGTISSILMQKDGLHNSGIADKM